MASDFLSAVPNLSQNRSPFNYEKIEVVSRDYLTQWLDTSTITDQINLFDDQSQDTYLERLELAVRVAVEDYLGISIFPTTYKTYYANPAITGIAATLNLPEVTQGVTGITINSVGYWDGNVPSVFQTMAKTTYQYDPTGNQIIVNSFPSNISTQVANPIVVQYTTASNPLINNPAVMQAALLLFTHWYNNRSNSVEGMLKDIPFGFTQILLPYKPLVM